MGKRILVVDDDLLCLKTVQKYLMESSYEVLCALSGMQAIHMIAEMKMDLLLLDIEMPGMSGFATLEQIRKLPSGSRIPVIFFTGRKDRDTVKCCAAAGAEGYITKPIEKHILLERIEEALSGASDGQEEKTILIIDTDVELLKQLKVEFKNQYKIVGISSVKVATDYFISHGADVIVMGEDVLLSEGTDAMTALRQTEPVKQIPMILLCEANQKEADQTYASLDIHDYLDKPVQTGELRERMQVIIKEQEDRKS